MSFLDRIRRLADEEKPEERITVREIMADYKQDFYLRGCRSKQALGSVMKTIDERLGDLTVSRLSPIVLRQYQKERRAEGKAAATVNKELALMKAALNLAAVNERIEAVPKFPKLLPTAAPRQGFLEHDDFLRIRQFLPSWGKDVLDFAFWSGWRRSEVLELVWSEVDLENREVRINPGRVKNAHARLPLPLRDFGLAAIERRERARVEDEEHVFLTSRSKPIGKTTWLNTWRDATEKADRSHFLFHDIRRSVARRLELAGIPRQIAMGWIGHRSEGMYRRYAITNTKDVADAAERLITHIEKGEEGEDHLEDVDVVRVRVETELGENLGRHLRALEPVPLDAEEPEPDPEPEPEPPRSPEEALFD